MTRARRAIRLTLRHSLLFVVSIVGMAMLGAVAYAVATRGQGAFGDLWPEIFIPAGVGAFVGIFSAPSVMMFLQDAQLGRSLPRVYGVSLAITVLWSLIIPIMNGITAAAPAIFSVIMMSARCGDRYSLPRRSRHRCENCDYDLSGLADTGCPECGWGRGE
jgi:hypothetical protein